VIGRPRSEEADSPSAVVHRPTIVVGVDGSRAGWNAFFWACGEAARSSGRVQAAYVSADACITSAAAPASAVAGAFVDHHVIDVVGSQRARELHAKARRQAEDRLVASASCEPMAVR
jgi:predicted RNase H-like nuclease